MTTELQGVIELIVAAVLFWLIIEGMYIINAGIIIVAVLFMFIFMAVGFMDINGGEED